MKASLDWLKESGRQFSDGGLGRAGCAHLQNYTVDYCEWGDGPPLVLVPGLAGGMELVAPLARSLSHHFRVIAYQLRGEDDCFALRRRFGMRDLVDDLAEFLDWHCLEAPALFGVSFGGALALSFAIRFPHRLGLLGIQGAGVRFEPGLLRQIAGSVLARYPLPPDSPFVNQFFNLLFGGRQNPGPLVQFVVRRWWHTDQSVMAHRFQMVEQLDMKDSLCRIAVPTLVLAGDRDLLISEKGLQQLAVAIPRAKLVRLTGCGHLAFVTQPGRVSEEVCRFFLETTANKG